MLKLLSCLVIIIGFSTPAFAIHCYECLSIIDYDQECVHPLAINCDTNGIGKHMGCIYYEHKAKEDYNDILKKGSIAMVRGCYNRSLPQNCLKDPILSSDPDGITELTVCKYCTTDLCNSSASTGIFTAAVMSFIVLVVRMMS